jgi:hypothetical protein
MSEAPTVDRLETDAEHQLDPNAPAEADADEAVVIELEQIRRLTPGVVYAPGRIERTLTAIEADARKNEDDVSTPEGREQIRSRVYQLRQIKSALDNMGKALTEVWRQQTNQVNLSRGIVRDRLDRLINERRAALTAFELAEEQRVLEHEQALGDLQALTVWWAGVTPTAEMIEPRLEIAQRLTNRDWQEFAARAERIRGEAITALTAMLAQARQREAEAAELATLRAEQAKRVQQTLEREAADRDRQRAEDAAAALVQKAQQDAEAAKQALVEKHEREIREAREREEAATRRADAARQMAEARDRDETNRVAAAIDKARKDDAAALAAQQATEAAATAAEAKRARARAHVREVNRMMVALVIEVSQIGSLPASKIVEAIATGRFTPYIALDYQGRLPL